MSNPVAANSRSEAKSGNKMALGNIRQRFELAYGNRALSSKSTIATTPIP